MTKLGNNITTTMHSLNIITIEGIPKMVSLVIRFEYLRTMQNTNKMEVIKNSLFLRNYTQFPYKMCVKYLQK